MSGYWGALLVAAAVSIGLTPVVRRLAFRLGALDRPVARSVHKQPVPLLGGVAIFLGFAAACAYAFGLGQRPIQGILLGGVFIVIFGIADDYLRLRPWVKLLGQVAGALFLVVFGVQIETLNIPLVGSIILGWWAVPVTIVWVVAVTNVINLIDGLDGLAAGISSIAAVTLLVSALQTHQPPASALLAAALAGAVLGFLPYNFNPAKIFMGDAGSMFAGYALAAVSVEGTLKSPAAVALVVPLLALGLPILDTALAIIRRWRGGRPIGEADKEHLHHRLLNLGLNQRDAVLVMYLASGWLGVSALAITGVSTSLALAILAFVAFSLYFLARKVGMLPTGTGTEVIGVHTESRFPEAPADRPVPWSAAGRGKKGFRS